MKQFVYATLHPEIYHGHDRRPPFFEGWYYKLVSADENKRLAVIPGVILGQDAHCFVQTLDGISGKSSYFRYPYEAFRASQTELDITVGPNHFTRTGLSLDLPDGEVSLKGQLSLVDPIPWPVRLFSPGIMGWFAWMPRMECYHGVLGFDHAISGTLRYNGAAIRFDGGRGYMEKDWGMAFPKAWVWFQSNHFDQPGVCITASIATIPWMGSAFRGFIVGLWLNGTLHRFATYTGARVEHFEVHDTHVDWTISGGGKRLSLRAERAEGGLLMGPSTLDMGRRVVETLSAAVEVRLTDRDGRELFSGRGRHAGLEVHDTRSLT